MGSRPWVRHTDEVFPAPYHSQYSEHHPESWVLCWLGSALTPEVVVAVRGEETSGSTTA